MRRGWISASSACLALFAGAIYFSSKLPLLDALGFGPGFFPLILGLLGAVLSVALLMQLARAPADAEAMIDGSPAEDLVPDRGAVFRILGIIVLLAAAFTLLGPLGYRLTALLFMILLLLVLGVRNYVAIAAVSLVLSFGVFHAFYHWLKVPLPIGGFGL